MPISHVDHDRVTRLLMRDVAATIGSGHEAAVIELASRLRPFVDEAAEFEWRLADEVQQHFHDSFVDTTWPSCPRHPNHPLWFSDGSWRCEREARPIARFGELTASRHSASDLEKLLRTMRPVLNAGVVVFSVLPPGHDVATVPAIGLFREAEGTTVILEEEKASGLGLAPLFRAAWITLTVHSDLHAVGLTAAVSRVLADAGISCNVIAAVHHDHLFVPAHAGEEALHLLRQLQGPA